ncbi:hypothetical protein G0P98_20055 [Yangia sp. PrR004]|nr:hypothetical protein [Salipiger sp. PrR004]
MYVVISHTLNPSYLPWGGTEINFSAIATSCPTPPGATELRPGENVDFLDGTLSNVSDHDTFEGAMSELLGMHGPNPIAWVSPQSWQDQGFNLEDIKIVLYPAHLEHVEPEDTWRFVECNSDSAAWGLKTESELLDHAAQLYSKGKASGLDLDPETVLLALRDMSGLKPPADVSAAGKAARGHVQII